MLTLVERPFDVTRALVDGTVIGWVQPIITRRGHARWGVFKLRGRQVISLGECETRQAAIDSLSAQE